LRLKSRASKPSFRRCARSWRRSRGDWQKLHALADRERELGDLLGRRMADWEKASAELQRFLEEV